jgi:hypothetical protein
MRLPLCHLASQEDLHIPIDYLSIVYTLKKKKKKYFIRLSIKGTHQTLELIVSF